MPQACLRRRLKAAQYKLLVRVELARKKTLPYKKDCGGGCDVGLGREKYMSGNDGWGQTWSHTSLGKCERHRTLVDIHWLTINAKKGLFIRSGESPKKCLWVRWEVERDGGSFKLLSLVFVCHAWDI